MESPERHPVVVIGASAGGIQALIELVSEIPADFNAPILVVVHIGRGRSNLPCILERSGALPASHAVDGEPVKPGRIYVAPPDYHMLIRDGHIALSRGPRENHSRPAIDPLFRSAATSYGQRVIGIVLSGALSDGTIGLMMIKARGGTVIVQDPDDAVVSAMPSSALQQVEVDAVLSARQIGVHLAGLPRHAQLPTPESSSMVDEEADTRMIHEDFREQENNRRAGELTMFTCPDCGGTLWQSSSGAATHFRCHVGHTWGAEALLGHKSEQLEAALWASVRLLEERATLSRQVADRLRDMERNGHRAQRVDDQAELDERRADAIRDLLHSPMNLALQMVEKSEQGHESDD